MSQGDGYFLIGKTPGKAAAEYNRIVGLEIISEKLSKGKSIISDITSTIKVLTDQIKGKEEQLSNPIFIGVNKRLERIGSLAENRKKLLGKQGHLSELRNLISAVSVEKEVIAECKAVLKKEKDVKAIKDKIEVISTRRGRVNSIFDIVDEISFCKRDKLFYDELLKNSKDFYDIKNRWEATSNLRSKLSSIESLVRDIENSEKSKEEALQIVAEGKKIKTDIEKRMGYCPKCGSDRKYWRKELVR